MKGPDSSLLQLDDALEALGDNGTMDRYEAEVALADVVGTISRAEDFDATFSPRRRDDRWRRIETMFDEGSFPPPIDIVQLGDLLFVQDGHHRVSVAKSLGWDSLPARVRRVCTVAYALCCLRVSDLPTKAAERRFLEKLPLPDDVRRTLSLSDPADWARLADSALAWGYSHLDTVGSTHTAHDLASAWWQREVRPVVRAMRAEGVGTRLSDVQLYVTALGVRDRLGALDWPGDLAAEHPDEICCRAEVALHACEPD